MIPRQPLALVLTPILADIARNVRRVRAVLEVIATNSRQGGVLQSRPFMIGLGQPPNLIRDDAKVAERPAEWFAVVDRIEELLPYVSGEPLLCFCPSPGSACRCAHGGTRCSGSRCASPQMCRGLLWSPQQR